MALRSAFWICVFALFLGGCKPDVALPPPPQAAPHPYFARVRLDMTPGMPDPWHSQILEGVDPPNPELNWRWIYDKSRYRFELEDRADWVLDLHLTQVGYVREALGPQTLKVLVNGQEVAQETLDKPGPVFLHYPVRPGSNPEVELLVHPCQENPKWHPYCVLLHSVGFSREIQ